MALWSEATVNQFYKILLYKDENINENLCERNIFWESLYNRIISKFCNTVLLIHTLYIKLGSNIYIFKKDGKPIFYFTLSISIGLGSNTNKLIHRLKERADMSVIWLKWLRLYRYRYLEPEVRCPNHSATTRSANMLYKPYYMN